MGEGVTLSACSPRAFPFRPGAVRAGRQQLVPRRLPSCGLNGALCRAGWWPALPRLPWRVPACLPRLPQSLSAPLALDTTKDPCQKVKCSRHKVCVAQGYQRAMCISRKKLEHR